VHKKQKKAHLVILMFSSDLVTARDVCVWIKSHVVTAAGSFVMFM
jgi:hypothetical protein